MAKEKYCDVGGHVAPNLWDRRIKDKLTGKITQKSCCKNCLHKREKKSDKKKDPEKETATFKKDLNVFFASQILVFPKHCENCGHVLDTSSPFAKRSQICHILPKTKNGGFPSIATHPSNKIFMCCFRGCYGHGKYDNGDAETRKSMKVYQIAIERFRSVENELTEKEKMKAYKYLGLDQSELL